MSKLKQPIIIEGITTQGKTFRPSDWAERMSGVMATFNNRRIYYSPLLQPSVTNTGLKCILVDPQLKESSPHIFNIVIDFAKNNNLMIHGL